MEKVERDWIELLQEAKDLGLTLEEVKRFLETCE
ncbi:MULTISPECIES: DNA-binding anti-repressor SinI [Salimicrobium]|uniref:DNA-binding anti-repressor SinI n=1 Tax=Salimicrobium humidisoli TaxID=2029857 RepID=A0ABX4HR01_9BACI|nr:MULTISPECIES: DNA-binding anti-repressor SinI [Salimicrobium]MBM7695096.1 DNA-binding transcriptional MerR regulator [Salimicrobium jeotgali]PBB05637.1 DNA-binding anti-repressor SinI [Salimicrobium humidisoli]